MQAAVSELVRWLLRATGTTRQDLADLLELGPSDITHTLSDRPRRRWSAHDVRLLCLRFDVSPEVLWGDDVVGRRVLMAALGDRILDGF